MDNSPSSLLEDLKYILFICFILVPIVIGFFISVLEYPAISFSILIIVLILLVFIVMSK